MALELAGVTLEKLTKVEVHERARFARHAVPGMSGELTQNLGRPSVVVIFQGIFYGAEAADKLKELRDKYLARDPVDLLADAVGEGYFSQVLIERLQVAQRAGFPDEFDYLCEVVEYVPPPPPATQNPLGGLDAGLLDEASGLMDDVQNALGKVAELGSLLAGAADYGNPTTRLPTMLSSFTDAAGGATTTLGDLAKLF